VLNAEPDRPRWLMEAVSKALERSIRSLHNDMKLAAGDTLPRASGRPAHSDAAHWQALVAVREQFEVQGFTTGWRPLDEALKTVPTRLVQEWSARWKQRRRVRRAREAQARRVSVQVHKRDALWSIDATHLGRAGADAQQAEVVKELATTRVVGVSLGCVATGEDVVRLLTQCVQDRGVAPLVLCHDNGKAYCCGLVSRWCAENGVIELVNEPRTPQHNAACERGIKDLKAECELGSGCELVRVDGRLWVGDASLDGAPQWCRDVQAAMQRLNCGRLRGSRGYKTAAQLDRETASAESWACRESFHQAACSAIEDAVRDARGARARRRATREAIYRTLERFGMVTRTRGGVLISPPASAGVS
jgi:transposase InsO family protein